MEPVDIIRFKHFEPQVSSITGYYTAQLVLLLFENIECELIIYLFLSFFLPLLHGFLFFNYCPVFCRTPVFYSKINSINPKTEKKNR